MHLLVPGAYRRRRLLLSTRARRMSLNAPSGAGCLPTECGLAGLKENTVSMHLLVPGAYRQYQVIVGALSIDSLNAPSGAGCLPTRKSPPMRFSLRVSMHLLVPGAYRHETSRSKSFGPRVSMHLLVPGAYRLDKPSLRWSDRSGSQCTFWCRVLTDPRGSDAGAWDRFLSQCTFWCRVLTDAAKEDRRPPPHSASQCTFWCRVLTDKNPAPIRSGASCLNAPSGAGCLPTESLPLPPRT